MIKDLDVTINNTRFFESAIAGIQLKMANEASIKHQRCSRVSLIEMSDDDAKQYLAGIWGAIGPREFIADSMNLRRMKLSSEDLRNLRNRKLTVLGTEMELKQVKGAIHQIQIHK